MLRLTPIYGNGWTDGERTIQEPPPFEISIEEQTERKLRGKIVSKGHPYEGRSLSATRSFSNDNSVFSCTIMSASGVVVYGYCKV